MKRSDSIDKLTTALAKAQAKMEAAAKDSDNPFFRSKYADLASCWAAWRPAGPPNGLALMQFATASEERLDPPIQVQADGDRKAKTIHFIQRVSVETLLAFEDQWVSETLTVLVKDDSPQSTILGETYCRRGGMCAVIGIAPEDDDGNAAAGAGDSGNRQTTPRQEMPVCPKCHENTAVIVGKAEYGGGFVCFGKKGGCGWKWHAGAEHAMEPPPLKSKAAEVAQQHGLTTADKLPEKTVYQKALDQITKAVQGHDMALLTKISKLVRERREEGAITEAEDVMLLQEIGLAEKKIQALLNQGEAA